MYTRRAKQPFTLLACFLLIAACGSTSNQHAGTTPPPTAATPRPNVTPCGQTGAVCPTTTPPVPIVSGVPDPYPSEGSVTTADGKFIQYPDGLVLTVTGVHDVTRKLVAATPDCATGNLSYCDATKYHFIRVEMTVENRGSVVLPIANDPFDHVYYGVNRQPASRQLGLVNSTEIVSSVHEPTQLTPGTSFVFARSYDILDSTAPLSVQLYPAAFPLVTTDGAMRSPYIWTDVQTLLGN